MSPWRASTGERKEERTPRETSVCEILWATKPDLPTPVKKTVPAASRSARVNARVWEWSIRSKKKLRWFCCDLKRSFRMVSSMWPLMPCLGETPFGNAGREPISIDR